MRSRRPVLLALALAAAAAVAISAPALTKGPKSDAAQTRCTATFHVVHNDRIGSLQLPAGMYQLTTFQETCAEASILFAEFLKDFNGRLPRPWRYTVQGVGQGTFLRRSGIGGGVDQARFTVVRTGDFVPSTPGHPADGGGSNGDLNCGFFEVENNDRIGPLRLPAGRYLVTTLGPRLSCSSAISLFRTFLNRPRGNLPGGWVVLGLTGEFVKGSTNFGFRVKETEV